MIDYLTPACFGVMCPTHKDCRRYAAIENAPHTQQRIATCVTSDRQYPLFTPKGDLQHATHYPHRHGDTSVA